MTALYALVVLAAATLGGDDDVLHAEHVDAHGDWVAVLPSSDSRLPMRVVRIREHELEPDHAPHGHVLIIPGLARGDAEVTGDGGPVAPIGGE